MGVVEGVSIRSLCASPGTAMNIIEKDQQTKNPKKYVNSGTLTALNCSIEHHPTFSDFISGGMEVSLMVAIDFTGSNGDPALPASLHYINPMGMFNPYQVGMRQIVLFSCISNAKFFAILFLIYYISFAASHY